MAEREEKEEEKEVETDEEEVAPCWLFRLTGAQVRTVKSGIVNLR